MKIWLGMVVAVAMTGCGKAADCASAVGHAITFLDVPKGIDAKLTKYTTDVYAAVGTATVARCKADQWSSDTLTCLVDAKSQDDLKKCDAKLTPEQRESMDKAVDEAKKTVTRPATGSAGNR